HDASRAQAAEHFVTRTADRDDGVGAGGERSRVGGERRAGRLVERIGKRSRVTRSALHADGDAKLGKSRDGLGHERHPALLFRSLARNGNDHSPRSYCPDVTAPFVPAARRYWMRTAFRSVPIRSISTSKTSPSAKNSGGLRAKPTPSGVPVAITSPGRSVIPLLSSA